MSEEKESRRHRRSRASRSLFGPLVLITIGVFFLLANLDLLPALDWYAALRLWPLLLIFLGLNVLAQQFPRPFGTILSGLVAVAAILTFSFVLLGGNLFPGMAGWQEPTLEREKVGFPLEDTQRARVEIDFNYFPAAVEALQDSPSLIEADVAYEGELLFKGNRDDGLTTVVLDSQTSSMPFFWLDPANWGIQESAEGEWLIGLSPRVPLDLLLDLSSGDVVLDLSQLDLDSLEIDGSSGESDLLLPAGDYEARYELSSGDTTIHLPDAGHSTYNLDASSGELLLMLPAQMEAQIVVVDTGSGDFEPGERFVQTKQLDGEEGTWETRGFAAAVDRTVISLDLSSGAVRVEEP